MVQYFFRIDDAAPNMNWDNFNLLVSIFRKHGVEPLLAVIPDNNDPKLLEYPINNDFWAFLGELRQNNWTIGQHGFQHLPKARGGVLKIHNSGEFGGLEFGTQEQMIRNGKSIIESKLGKPEVFVAPRHSFDYNTIRALDRNNFKFISDGIALYPFKKWGLIWLPQILWRPRMGMIGLVTVALHPNTMSRGDIENLQKFIEKNRNKIGNFKELMEWYGKIGFFKKIYAQLINWPFKIFWRIIFSYKHGLSK